MICLLHRAPYALTYSAPSSSESFASTSSAVPATALRPDAVRTRANPSALFSMNSASITSCTRLTCSSILGNCGCFDARITRAHPSFSQGPARIVSTEIRFRVNTAMIRCITPQSSWTSRDRTLNRGTSFPYASGPEDDLLSRLPGRHDREHVLLLVDRDVDEEGRLRLLGLEDRVREVAVALHADGPARVGLGDLHEVRDRPQVDRGEALPIEHPLPLQDHAEGAVVHHNHA